jgi:hypothetical protein
LSLLDRFLALGRVAIQIVRAGEQRANVAEPLGELAVDALFA